MSMRNLLPGWTKPPFHTESNIRKYSTTGDILAFKRCKKQYGLLHVRGFSSSNSTQRYFGTLVHDVLDRIHRSYRLNPILPTEVEVAQFVSDAHDRLVRSGVRTLNPRQQKQRATKLIYRFVRMIGPYFFQHVQKTEYRLERALKTHTNRDYVLEGIVDVLSGAISHALNMPFSTEADDVEIWDYKSGQAPLKTSREMRDYEYQMRVYAELYKLQTGDYPARCVLVFVGELDNDANWDDVNPDIDKFPRLFFTISPNNRHIQAAMTDFHQTVEDIEAERVKPYNQQWDAPDPITHEVDSSTCAVCDFRYNCSHFIAKYDPQGHQHFQPL